VWAVLRKPRFLPNEDERQYWKTLVAFSRSVSAETQIEWLLVQDATDQTWELRRILQAKEAILGVAFDEALFEILAKVHPDDSEEKILKYCNAWRENP